MSTGLKVWDASGSLTFDTTTRCGRVLGVTTATGSSGSITNADFSQGTPWAIAVTLSSTSSVPIPCYTTFSGNTLNWAYPTSISGGYYNTMIVYGVY